MVLDISHICANDGLLDDVGIVIMCLDQENIEFVQQCIQRGIHYIDLSASYHILFKIEELNKDAQKAGATAVLSVGLAPGLTNLLTKQRIRRSIVVNYLLRMRPNKVVGQQSGTRAQNGGVASSATQMQKILATFRGCGSAMIKVG